MKIRHHHFNAFASLAHHASTTSGQAPSAAAVNKTTAAVPRQRLADQLAVAPQRSSSGNQNGYPHLATRMMKYAFYAAGAAYAYDRTANDCFLSTTSLHDGKGGFSSDARLIKAEERAEKYYQAYCEIPNSGKVNAVETACRLKLFGNNQFSSMVDYRAATKVHLKNLLNTEQAHDSIMKSITCLKGGHMRLEDVARHGQKMVPRNLDITQSPQYTKKNKYSLMAVRNDETGSTGYISRTITRPFIERGINNFTQEIQSNRALSPKQAVDALDSYLSKDRRFGGYAQLAAGQAFLIFSRTYEDNWGTSHKILMPFLGRNGWLDLAENNRIGTTRPFSPEDMKKGLLRRNTSVMGPFFHDIYVRSYSAAEQKGLMSPRDFSHREVREMRYVPIAHFKMNDSQDGIEDSSGFGDSFTSYNVAVCINHARMMSNEARLSKADVVALIGCLNAVYDNASSVRHSLQETARGCFAGAGYTIDDADDFYKAACKNAAIEFYGGKRQCQVVQRSGIWDEEGQVAL
ncbi:hypothetical protein OKW49_006283 [Paraburkholderia youngii]|uniref:XopAG/AvrGf1 family type III secretion system effector n=1 Tax=Paraburkholderia youngii TaxID=2782701 RepID=UPI003D1FB180